MITETTIDRVRALLSGCYRTQHTEEGLQAILLACLDLTDYVFEEAVARHLSDTCLDRDAQPVGNWFPKPAQILRHPEQIEQERRRAALTVYQSAQKELAAPEPGDNQVELHLPDAECQEYGLPPVVRMRPSRCPHCADSGMARFYHDRKELRRVWLAREFLDLPEAMRSRLDCASAICDCPIGQQRPERAWMTTILYQGADRQVTVSPLLELIRKVAQRRQWADSQAISAARLLQIKAHHLAQPVGENGPVVERSRTMLLASAPGPTRSRISPCKLPTRRQVLVQAQLCRITASRRGCISHATAHCGAPAAKLQNAGGRPNRARRRRYSPAHP